MQALLSVFQLADWVARGSPAAKALAGFLLKSRPEAVKELEKAIDEKQPDGTILDHLGDAYLKSGNAAKARSTWKRAKGTSRGSLASPGSP